MWLGRLCSEQHQETLCHGWRPCLLEVALVGGLKGFLTWVLLLRPGPPVQDGWCALIREPHGGRGHGSEQGERVHRGRGRGIGLAPAPTAVPPAEPRRGQWRKSPRVGEKGAQEEGALPVNARGTPGR